MASQFYYCLVKSVSNNKCTIVFNNKEYVVPFYGGSPKANKTYAVFLPQNNMNQAFVIGEGASGGGGGSGIAIQPDPPTNGELVWIDTDDPGTTHIIPEIDDTQESTTDTWSSQKIASEIANTTEFEPVTGSFSTYNCSGTISTNPSNANAAVVYVSKDKKRLWIRGGRITISSFSRSSPNPGVRISVPVAPSEQQYFGCGFRMDSTNMRPEAVFGSLTTDGRLTLQTTESYTNASGNPLHLMVSSCIIPVI